MSQQFSKSLDKLERGIHGYFPFRVTHHPIRSRVEHSLRHSGFVDRLDAASLGDDSDFDTAKFPNVHRVVVSGRRAPLPGAEPRGQPIFRATRRRLNPQTARQAALTFPGVFIQGTIGHVRELAQRAGIRLEGTPERHPGGLRHLHATSPSGERTHLWFGRRIPRGPFFDAGDYVDEFDTLAELVDQFAEDGFAEDNIDAAVPALANAAASAVVSPVARQTRKPLNRLLQRQLIRSAEQSVRTLVRHRGLPAIRALPRVVQRIRQQAAYHNLSVASLPQALYRTMVRVTAQPQLIRSLSQRQFHQMDLLEESNVDAAFQMHSPYATKREMVEAVRQLETGMRPQYPGAPLPRNQPLTDLQRRGLMENV